MAFTKLTRLTQTFWIKKLSREQWSGVSLPWTRVPSLMTPWVPGDGGLGLPILAVPCAQEAAAL